ncbi:MAG: glycosyl hydrolase [Bacteroidetes bacterium]|nr:MAG: glycosyl hydrolase [Bacteroidota bacterium]
MKTRVKLFHILALLLSTVVCNGQESSDTPFIPVDTNMEYWISRSREVNPDFRKIADDFKSYWAGKKPVKGTGYKQFRRWLESQKAYLNPDGSVRLPQEDLENAINYNLQYSSGQIQGNWTYAGPFQPIMRDDGTPVAAGGRVTSIGFSPHDSQKIFAGAPLGGLWVSNNNGTSWQNLNTDSIATLGVSAIAVHPTNPDIIYFGTGDRDAYNTAGKGVYKSIDGGQTWVAKPFSVHYNKVVCKILFHPVNYERLVAACNTGIYVTTNGGNSWTRKLNVAIKDMDQKPGDSTLYAVSDNSFYKSTDFGQTWVLTKTTLAHRIAIGTTPDNPEKVILFTSRDSKFYRIFESTNSGDNFFIKTTTGISDNDGQGWYNLDLVVDPEDENIMYSGMVSFYKSTDGGSSWVRQEDVYASDQHIFEFSPQTHRLFIGNDAGMWFSDNGTDYTFSSNGLNITEIYYMDVAAQNANHIIIGNQDAGTFVTTGGPSYRCIGGDGMTCKIDYSDNNYIYGTWQEGNFLRSVNGTVPGPDFALIAAENQNGINQSGNWQSAFLLDYSNTNRMFVGMRDIWRSNNIKEPDGNDIFWYNISNGALGEGASIEFIEQSRVDGQILYVFTDQQRIFRTTNAYAITPEWTELVNPTASYDVKFESHPTEASTVYMVCGQKVYKSIDMGTTWNDISVDLPPIGMLSLAYMNGSNEGLFLGTTAGVYYKEADMEDWVPFKTGIPLTKVRDMVINYSTTPAQLFASTYGRGIWKTNVLTSFLPDLLANSGSTTLNATTMSAVAGIQNLNTMTGIPELTSGFYLSSNNIIAGGDYLIRQNTHTNVGPGLIFQSQMPATDLALVQPEIPSGTYYFGFLADNIYNVNEYNENNNMWVSPTQIVIPVNPATAENVQATDGSFSDRTTITWQDNSGEILYYAVFRATIGIPALAQQISPATWLSQLWFNDVTAANGVTYYYFVKTSRYPDGSRASEFSGYDAGFRRLSPPGNVMATDGLYSDKIAISWDASPGASHYQVYRSTAGNPLIVISGPTWISNTMFEDTDVLQGTTYTYYIKAAKSQFGSNESEMSAGDAGWEAFATAPTATASDGLYTNRIAVTWNTVPSATHYMLYRSTSNIPNNASPITAWQTASNYTDYGANTGITYYYWVKASMDATGTVTTGLGQMDQGYRNFNAPSGVSATDGTSTTGTVVTWNIVSGATWYRVNRGTSSNFTTSRPIGNWVNTLSLTDVSGNPGTLYYYWVACSNDTAYMASAFSSSNTGYKQIIAPVTQATDGYYADRVEVTWQAVAGAAYYQIQRSPVSDPGNLTTLAPWSNTLGFTYADNTAAYQQEYLYFVTGSGNASGLRPGNPGSDQGSAASCINLVDMPAFRSIYFHGTTLDITQQVMNEGPYPMMSSSTIAYAIESDPAGGSPEAIIGTTTIPPLAPGEVYTVYYQVNLDTVNGFNLTYGTWYLGCYTAWDSGNCDHNPSDDYILWQDPNFTYTDALHGIYTVGPGACDYPDPDAALSALKARGISDNTIFYLEPVVFYQQLAFTSIQGTEFQRKIIFKTNPAYTDTAEIRGIPTPEANYTLFFQNCNNLSFTNLKISTSGASDFESTYGRVISIGPGCSDLRFRYNHIEGYTDVSHGGTDNIPIYSQSPQNNLLIDNNVITNGWLGIYLSGRQANPISGFTISNNRIENFYTRGISLHETADFVITGNTVSTSNNTSVGLTGIDLGNSRGGFDCSRNHIMLSSSTGSIYGLISSDVDLVDGHTRRITNNFISCSTESVTNAGINLGTNMNTTVAHNSVHVYGNSGILSYCIQIHSFASAPDFNNKLFNNILVNTAGGSGLNYYHNNLNFNLLNQSDYNNIYTSSGTLISYGQDNFTSLSSWNAATGFDQHSLSVSPEFLTETNLHCNSPLLDGAGIYLPEVAWDMDNEPRSTVNPDIGADEFSFVSLPKTLNLGVLLEGLYNGPNTLRQANDENGPRFGAGIADQIAVELRSATDYNNVVHLADHVNLSTSGLASLTFPSSLNGSYYVTVRHRNSITTVSANPVHFITGTISHSFNSPATAYGGNMLLMITGQYVIYGGDVNQDGSVDTGDMTPVDNDAAAFASGYLTTDVNGDGTIDTGDITIIDNNAASFVGAVTP